VILDNKTAPINRGNKVSIPIFEDGYLCLIHRLRL